MSSFGSLNTALSGLITQRRVLDTVGHNIANSSTDGYSRRRVDLAAAGAWTVPAMYSRSTVAGNGVTVEGVTRIRDSFLEGQAIREHGAARRLEAEASMLARIEAAIPEPSDVGLSAQLGDFYAAWDDLANGPGNEAGRLALLQQASTLASTLNRVSTDLTNLRNSAVGEASLLVDEVNSATTQIAELNQSITQATAAGLDPHDLADRRDLLVMKVADLIGITVSQGPNGTVDLSLGGSSLVRGDRAEQLMVAEPEPVGGDYAGIPLNRVEIQWSIDSYPAQVTSGRIAGLVATANVHVPQTILELDKVASTLVQTVNDLHQTGKGLDAADVDMNFWDPTSTTAASIKLSSDVDGQPSRVAAAATTAGPLDASIAQAIAALHQQSGTAESVYNEMVGRMAIDTQALTRRSEIQSDIATQSDDARLSVSGVNLDEELTSLMTAQRSYQAAARLMTSIDEALDTLINRTGVVGR